MKKEIVDITAKIRVETDKAYQIDDGTRKVWVPKSQVENNGDGTFTMPVYLAVEKGLV